MSAGKVNPIGRTTWRNFPLICGAWYPKQIDSLSSLLPDHFEADNACTYLRLNWERNVGNNFGWMWRFHIQSHDFVSIEPELCIPCPDLDVFSQFLLVFIRKFDVVALILE